MSQCKHGEPLYNHCAECIAARSAPKSAEASTLRTREDYLDVAGKVLEGVGRYDANGRYVRPAPAPAADAAEQDDPEALLLKTLLEDNKRLREAGLKLAEAALRVIRECDGLHRLAWAVAEWTEAVASESGRPHRAQTVSVRQEVDLP